MKLWSYSQICRPHDNVPAVDSFRLNQFLTNLEDCVDRRDSRRINAGYTYFGQFVDHDLSFMQQSDLAPTNGHVDLDELLNRRRPSLDLDSVYGAGLDDSAVPFDKASGKFVMGRTEGDQERDLPRGKSFQALIADSRNDENLLVAQMQVLFMNLHNKIIDALPRMSPEKAFSEARHEVVQLYQNVVLGNFASTLIPGPVYRAVIRERRGRLRAPDRNNPSIPIEFVSAAFRLHGMVRTSYRLNASSRQDLLTLLTYRLDPEQLKSSKLLDRFVVEWREFFSGSQFAMAISPHLSFDVPDLFDRPSPGAAIKSVALARHLLMNNHHHTPDLGWLKSGGKPDRPFNLVVRTLRRGHELRLCSAQQLIEYLARKHAKEAKEFGLADFSSEQIADLGVEDWRDNTPLWLYCMLEAYERHGGELVGTLGGWIVADALAAAAESTRLKLDPRWSPARSILRESRVKDARNPPADRDFTLLELVEFTYPNRN